MDIEFICQRCGDKFVVNTQNYKALGLNQMPRKCPGCADKIQKHDGVQVIERTCIEKFSAVRICLPENLFVLNSPKHRRERDYRKAVLKGNMWGTGRQIMD